MNIVRNSGTLECEILHRQIAFSDQRGKDYQQSGKNPIKIQFEILE